VNARRGRVRVRMAATAAIHDTAGVHLQKQLPETILFCGENALYREAAAGNWDSFGSRTQHLSKAFERSSRWKKMLDALGRYSASSVNDSTRLCPCVAAPKRGSA
jgi:hypothetical protein